MSKRTKVARTTPKNYLTPMDRNILQMIQSGLGPKGQKGLSAVSTQMRRVHNPNIYNQSKAQIKSEYNRTFGFGMNPSTATRVLKNKGNEFDKLINKNRLVHRLIGKVGMRELLLHIIRNTGSNLTLKEKVSQMTPLHLLCKHYTENDYDILNELIKKAPSTINTVDNNNMTPLHIAVKYIPIDHLRKVIQLFKRNNANVNIEAEMKRNNPFAPMTGLHTGIQYKPVDILMTRWNPRKPQDNVEIYKMMGLLLP